MTVLIILVIGLFWVAFLGPTILRARERQGRADSIGDFRHRLTLLGRTNGRPGEPPVLVPVPPATARPVLAAGRPRRPMSPTQKRRRDVLLSLAGAAALTLLLAFVARLTPFVLLHLLVDAALVAYVYLLVRMRQNAQGHRARIRLLGSAYRMPPPYLLDRAGDFGTSESDGPRLVPLRQIASR